YIENHRGHKPVKRRFRGRRETNEESFQIAIELGDLVDDRVGRPVKTVRTPSFGLNYFQQPFASNHERHIDAFGRRSERTFNPYRAVFESFGDQLLLSGHDRGYTPANDCLERTDTDRVP